MEKKLLAISVAVALAVPSVALAQSSVTISGFIQGSFDNMKLGNVNPARTGRTSEGRVNDESSSIVFSGRENLAGGLAGIFRVDFKPNIDTGSLAASGESWIGLSSQKWGSLTMGRHALHYFLAPDDTYYKGVSYRLHPSSLTDFSGRGAVAMANATRTANTIKWTSPLWGGFGLIVAYSSNPLGTAAREADMTAGNTARSGRGWNLHPSYTGSNWKIGYSYWDAKADAPSTNPAAASATAASLSTLAPTGVSYVLNASVLPTNGAQLVTADQRGNTLYGHYTWGGWKFGLLWNRSQLKAAATGAGLAPIGTEISDRTAWSIPIRYTTGPHNFMGSYTRASDDKATAGKDGARMWTLAYAYDLSKRTHVAFAVNQLKNDPGAAYSHYVDAGAGTNNNLAAGERARLFSIGIRHDF